MTAIVIFFALTILAYAWWSERNIRKLKKRAIRVDADINTLHQNQKVLESSLNNIYQEIKRNERQAKKNSKTIRRSREVSGLRKNEGSDPI